MISNFTKEKIIETARIEEVVGDFVVLKKKSGAYLMGLCPFHHEKTPSFTVTPSKGIYKCFGCGKAGSSIDFIMEHEHLTFPETLKYLAKKYHIEIEEENISDEEKKKRQDEESERESLYVASSFAQKYFSETLLKNPEGVAIGLSYFKERGFTDETTRLFQLGYSPEEKNSFTKTAIRDGFNPKYLVATGLSILPENHSLTEVGVGEKMIDRFRGRVMFPIHNLSGRVIGFGGRILKTELKLAKYVNSPESEIYHKSQVLYGIYFAKKEIIANDNCYLVEGYTDVISMYQAGVENVVASSGTSLTVDQIRLIARYTKNITMLYDGDAAGIKASMRGIDMILEEGMNVRIVLFPDGEDPDSYARKKSKWEIKDFITKNASDFILFKTQLMAKEAGDDPVKKAALIRDIVDSIAKVEDPILRAEYIKMCSVKMGMNEQTLVSETNKARQRNFKKILPTEESNEFLPDFSQEPQPADIFNLDMQERGILKLLLNFGHHLIPFEFIQDEKPILITKNVSEFILEDMNEDGILFENKLYAAFIEEFKKCYALANLNVMSEEESQHYYEKYFISHENSEFKNLAIELLTHTHELHDWKRKEIHVPQGMSTLKKDIFSSIYALKMKKLQKMIDDLIIELKDKTDEDEYTELQIRKKDLDDKKRNLGKIIGAVVWR